VHARTQTHVPLPPAAGEPLVTIAAFAPQLHVISSKQRPRKLTIHGGDGAEYMFLLKGHEDLRQDERVMQVGGWVWGLGGGRTRFRLQCCCMRGADAWQWRFGQKHARYTSRGMAPAVPALHCIKTQAHLDTCPLHLQLFGLVNTMLANDRETAERDLSIARYAVIPLSPNSGLIGWVPNTDTLHALIREYRDSKKIPLNWEHRWGAGAARCLVHDAPNPVPGAQCGLHDVVHTWW
jgi:hypothetical protein